MKEKLIAWLLGWLASLIGPAISVAMTLGKDVMEFVALKVKEAEGRVNADGVLLSGKEKFEWVLKESVYFLKIKGRDDLKKYLAWAIENLWVKLDLEQKGE